MFMRERGKLQGESPLPGQELHKGAFTQRFPTQWVLKGLEVAEWCCGIDLIRNIFVQVRGDKRKPFSPNIGGGPSCGFCLGALRVERLDPDAFSRVLTVRPVCQEELYNPECDVSINPNENSILTPQRPVPDVRLGYTSTGQR